LYKVEKATIKDASQMHKLINRFAAKELMLPRPLGAIYENLRDYFVVREGERVIACAALHISWEYMAEIRSVAVAEEIQKQRVGTQLLEACLDEARELGMATIFCLTYQPAFFEKFGFSQVDKMTLPRKVWSECFDCPKFPDCDEVALVHNLDQGA